jgi:drug/metabolite transporter superfamily protein YnfA
LLGDFFQTKEIFVEPMRSNATAHGLNILKSKTIAEFFSEMNTHFDWFLYNADLIFFIGFMSVLILLVLRDSKWILPTISGTISYFLFSMMWGADVARLFAASYGTVVVIVTLAVSWMVQQVSYGTWLYRFILLSLFLTFIHQRYAYLRSPNIQWFGQIYLTEESRRNWLSERKLFSADLFKMKDWMDQNISFEDEIYVYRIGYPFYLNRKYIACDVRFGEQMDKWLLKGDQYTLDQLNDLNVRWILFSKKSSESTYENAQIQWLSFIQNHLELIHQEESVEHFAK